MQLQSGKVEPKPFVLQQGKGLHFFYNDIFIQLYLYCHTITESGRKQSVRECRGPVSPLHFHSEISIFTPPRACRIGSGEWRLLEEEEWK